MKNTILTLVSVVALAGAANAQVTLGGVTYDAGDRLSFNNFNDFLAGTNASRIQTGNPLGLDRDISGSATGLTRNRATGFSTFNNGIQTGTAAWAANTVDGSWYQDGNNTIQVTLSVAALGFSSGDRLEFSSFNDYIAGNGTRIQIGNSLNMFRDISGTATGSTLNKITGASTFNNGTQTGTAAWSVGTVDAFWYHDAANAFQITVAQVPEPSSTALLGLSALGLLTRRRRS